MAWWCNLPLFQGVVRKTAKNLSWWCESGVGRDGVIGPFSGCHLWSSKIIGAMAWKWCMACDRSLFSWGESWLLFWRFKWCMTGEKVKKRIINKSLCAAISFKVLFEKLKWSHIVFISWQINLLITFNFSIKVKISYSSGNRIILFLD